MLAVPAQLLPTNMTLRSAGAPAAGWAAAGRPARITPLRAAAVSAPLVSRLVRRTSDSSPRRHPLNTQSRCQRPKENKVTRTSLTTVGAPRHSRLDLPSCENDRAATDHQAAADTYACRA